MEHASAHSHAADSHAAGRHATSGHDDHAQGALAHGGELPPVPSERHITPAPADFTRLPGASALLFPIAWCVIAGLLIMRALDAGWTLHHMELHAEQGESVEAGH